jgi:hypothetical protein
MNVLDRDLRYALSPVELFTDAVGIPDKFQADILNGLLDENAPRRSLLLASRQSGKSEVCACCALWTARFLPGSLTLLLSHSLRGSAELFRKVADQFHKTGGSEEGAIQESTLRLELKNKSRVISLPATQSTIRGYSGMDLCLLDEAAQIEDGMVHALLPSAATRPASRLFAMSTPHGRRGWFFNEWDHGEGYARYEVAAKDVSRISAEFLSQQLATLGPYVFAQEYENCWQENDMRLIASDLVAAAMVDTGERPFW